MPTHDGEPLGVMPRETWKYKRKLELIRAIGEYVAAEMTCKQLVEWVDELRELIDEQKGVQDRS